MSDERRPGPVPLVLHMAMVRAQYAGAQAALAVSPDFFAALPAATRKRFSAWQETYSDIPLGAISAALSAQCETRLTTFLAGVERYQTDPFRRPTSSACVVKTLSGSCILDHGGTGAPVLLVPSLINPGWVLDLLPGRSFAQSLAQAGFHVFSLDWGEPGPQELRFTMGDYVTQRILPALQHISASEGAVHLIGYCLGGNLALGAALLAPDLVRRFCAIATPWDFAAMGRSARAIVAATHAQLRPILAKTGLMPAEALQALFAQLDPTQIERKFVSFAGLDPGVPDERQQMDHFIALEDWSNSGPALAAGVVDECFGSFYRDNAAVKGGWHIGAMPVDPGALSCPAFVLAAQGDKLVPQASTLALAKQLPSAQVHTPRVGHVGMMVGRRAQQMCWGPVARWLGEDC